MPNEIVIGLAIAAGFFGGSGIAPLIMTTYLGFKRESRDAIEAIWTSYREQIQSAEARGDAHEIERLRREYEQQQEAWRAEQSVLAKAPRKITQPDAIANLSEAEKNELRALLDSAKPLMALPRMAEDAFLLGNAKFEAGRFEDALADFDRALELRPDHPETLNNRGNALHDLGRKDEALAAYDLSLQLRPNQPVALSNRGATLTTLARRHSLPCCGSTRKFYRIKRGHLHKCAECTKQFSVRKGNHI